MIAPAPRTPWRAIWHIATSDGLLVALLLSVAAGLAATTWLPQMPLGDPIAYAQWLSGVQARFGEATAPMQALGLFAITRSLGFRTLLALLGGCLSLRLVESGDRLRQAREMAEPVGEWRPLAGARWPAVVDDLRDQRYRVLSEPPLLQSDRWPVADLFPLLAHFGALLLLVGLLVAHLWGWRIEGLIVQSDERVALPGARWIEMDKDARDVTHSPAVVTFVERRGPGVQASATDGAGHPLSLQKTTRSDPVAQLKIALAEDQYFAIPEAQLVVRLAPQSSAGSEAHAPVLVQVYRSPPGQLTTEAVIEGDAELPVEDVTLEFASAPYARLTATFNPGRWPTGVGLLFLMIGLLGSIAWPARRFWLRKGAGQVEAAGDLPPTLAKGEED